MDEELREELRKLNKKIDEMDDRFDEVVGLINFFQRRVKL